ncbi:MAG: efflux RND transporter periplasmic adaptor subunit, partial [Vicinamibacteria bacterium]|nr:efflux RND transporter periplasmic adaptor subunit [Vicinamibacteria bacterium]
MQLCAVGVPELKFRPTYRRTAQRVLAVPLVALAALGAGCDRAITTGAEAAAPQETSAVTVRPRDFVRRVRLTGLTEATRFYVVTTPLLAGESRGSMVVTKLAGAGTAVKAGDLLVQFDSQAQDKAALDKRAEYQDLVQQIIQKRAEHDAARVKDESELTQARNAVKNYELETLKNEMLSRVLAEKNNQDLAEARSKVAALDEGFRLKRTAATAELRILEIRRDRAQAAMDHALDNSKGMTVTSPLDGLVVPKMTWRGNGPADIQEGDEMWPGAPVLQVVNQTSMQVRARVNQADAPVVRPGMPVVVRLDAYPDLQMPGRLAQMAPIGVPGSFSARVRAFSAIVTIEGSNARLLPDLTAAIDVEVERVKDALVVPWSAVTRKGDTASVRVREGN